MGVDECGFYSSVHQMSGGEAAWGGATKRAGESTLLSVSACFLFDILDIPPPHWASRQTDQEFYFVKW